MTEARAHRRHATLRERARAQCAPIRAFFDAARVPRDRGADRSCPSPGLELHLDAFAVERARYLITSPEYQMKRLLAGGHAAHLLARQGASARAKRAPHHNPEFTMLEWYRAGAALEAIADDTEALVWRCARAVDTRHARGAARSTPPWARLARRRGVRALRPACASTATRTVERCARRSRRPAGACRRDGDWDDVFFALVPRRRRAAARPRRGRRWCTTGRAPLCALAREKPGDPRVVERFEVYAAGLELCNAFGELTDAAEQRRRLESDLAERRRRGLPEYPDRREVSRRRWRRCRRRRGSPSASIAWRCCCSARATSATCSVRRRRAVARLEVVRATVRVVGDVAAVRVARRGWRPSDRAPGSSRRADRMPRRRHVRDARARRRCPSGRRPRRGGRDRRANPNSPTSTPRPRTARATALRRRAAAARPRRSRGAPRSAAASSNASL